MLLYGSVCSGIEAASVAWAPLGWRCAFLSEIEPFPRAVLEWHYKDVPLHGDFTTIEKDRYEAIDLLVGGTPCQDFSVAGLRSGLDGARGQLTIEFVRLAERLCPRWLLWENVPGILSIDGGAAFGTFLGLLGQCGYGFAYRVLDAQYFGVPQRRRRVFVVGYLGDWRPPAAVLFEPESLCWHHTPSREAGERVAGTLAAGAHPSGFNGRDAERGNIIVPTTACPANFAQLRRAWETGGRADADNLIANLRAMEFGDTWANGGGQIAVAYSGNRQSGPIDVATAVNAHGGPHERLNFETETFVTHSLRADGFDASENGTGRGTPPLTLAIRGRGNSHNLECRSDGIANAVLTPNGGRAGIGVGAVAFHENQRAETTLNHIAGSPNVRGGKPGQGYPAVQNGMSVRRLTPTECERLQGFPDGYTAITYRSKPAADGPRYRALGNSMAVPVMRWLGERITLVNALKHKPLNTSPSPLIEPQL